MNLLKYLFLAPGRLSNLLRYEMYFRVKIVVVLLLFFLYSMLMYWGVSLYRTWPYIEDFLFSQGMTPRDGTELIFVLSALGFGIFMLSIVVIVHIVLVKLHILEFRFKRLAK